MGALRHLWALAQEATVHPSAKLTALVEHLRAIGVGPASDIRVVIFSERIRTLDWIVEAVKHELGMSAEQVVTFHNSKNPEEQQQIIESFSMASSPLRVLVASDIASEGVNLHKQCHNLFHFDLPWSLITLEQRNGRIDRYGQIHPPEVHYLVYHPTDPEVASDVRILSKLIAKENAAHRALGGAGSLMGLHSESAEESAIMAALHHHTELEKESALEAVVPAPEVFDPWAFAGLSEGSGATGRGHGGRGRGGSVVVRLPGCLRHRWTANAIRRPHRDRLGDRWKGSQLRPRRTSCGASTPSHSPICASATWLID